MAYSVHSHSVFSRTSRQFFSGVLGLALFGLAASSMTVTTPADAQTVGGAEHGPALTELAGWSVWALPGVVASDPGVADAIPVVAAAVAPVAEVDVWSNLPASNPQQAFINSIVFGARESQRETGVPAAVTIAQGIL